MGESDFFQLVPKTYTTRLRLTRSHSKEIVFRHGHIAITDYKLGDNWEFEKSLSTFDETRWKYTLVGGYYVPELREFRINRGYNPGMLGTFFKGYNVRVENDAYPSDKIKTKLLSGPRDDFQRVALTFMCSQEEFSQNSRYTQQLIDAPTGDGKSQPDDTVIPTPDGPKLLKDLAVGDYVFNQHYEPVKILKIFPQGIKETYRIVLANGKSTRCSPDHLWKVKSKGKYKIMTTQEIVDDAFTSYQIPYYDPAVSGRLWSDVWSVTREDETPQRCILIDDPDHLYITEDDIITHNTYCGVSVTCFMEAKAIVIVPFGKLLEQWKSSFLDFTSIKADEIMIVKGSDKCMKILNGECEDIKIFIVSADTIGAFCKRYGNLATIEMLRATRAHIKIVDEIHREMKLISQIEALSNFRMNFYMSASPGRTGKKENWIFKTCFINMPRFGSKFKAKEELHINVLVKQYRFTPTAAQQKRMIQARTGYLNSKSYERELINAPEVQNADFKRSIRSMLKWSKGLLKEDNKILMLCETIDGTAFLQSIAEELFPGETSRYYGSMKQADKDAALTKRVICATVSSLGTGADIHGIQHVYNITTFTSWISIIQTSGRARKLKDGTSVFYIELFNVGYMKTFRQFEKRKPTLAKISRTGKIVVVE